MWPTKSVESGVYRVPTRTTDVSSSSRHAEKSTSDSRARMLPGFRSAERSRRRLKINAPPPVSKKAISPRNIHPIGDWLKAWTLLKIPLRVRKVAKLQRPKVVIAREIAVFFRVPAPIAAPAEFLVGPMGPEQKPRAQNSPGKNGPRSGELHPMGTQF